MPATGAMVELLLGSTWTDMTARTYLRDRITITRGRQDQGTRVDPGSCTLTLNNKGGYFSPRNPLSPLYGLIGRNTPIRVSAVGGTPWLGMPATGPARVRATTPDAAVLDITGDLDVRFDVQPDDWNSADFVELGGKWGSAGQRSWRVYMNSGFIQLEWTADGSTSLRTFSALGANPLTPRMCLRVILDVNNGASGNTSAFYAGPTLAGPWTQLGTDQVTAGITSIFNSTAPLELGDISASANLNAAARMYGAQVCNGINGTVVAAPDFTAQTPGATAFTDPSGRAWTVTAGGITNRHTRFLGEISAWPARWDVSGGDVYVPVQAAGIMRRLGQGASPLDSTLRRRISTWPTVVGYWPMEDGQGATQMYSPVPGVPPASVSGAQLASDDSLAGSLPLPSWPPLSVFGCRVPSYPASTSWQVQHVYALNTAPASYTTMLTIQTTGTVRQWQIAHQAGGARVRGLDSDGTLIVDQIIGVGSDIIGPWTRQRFSVTQSGSSVAWNIEWDVIGVSAGAFSGSFTGTSGRVASIQGSPYATFDGLRLGHVAVFSDANAGAFNGADTGFSGESAAARCVRLASEDGIPLTMPFGTVGTQAMGPQQGGSTDLDLLEEAADADVGILYEARDSIALAYRPRQSLYNQAPALALDYAARGEVAPPLEPIEDDTATRNDITISRPNGSAARVTLDTGALSTAAPPAGVGRYATSESRNVQDDDQLADLAAWLLHLGTVDEPRYPAVTVNLAAGPWLAGQAMTVDIGDLVTIDNPPPQLPPGQIVLMCQGYTETIGVYDWQITYNCSPGSPWTVGVWDDPVLGRADTDGSQLAAGVTATATTLSVAVTAGPLWVSDPAEYPFDLAIGGEVITAACPGTLMNSNPFMDSNVAGYSPSSSTIAWTQAVTHPWAAPSQGTVLVTPDGVSASGGVRSDLTAVGTVTPGASYVAMGWANSPGGWSDLRAVIDWYDSAGTLLSTGLGTLTAAPAAAWTFFTQTLAAPASASRARVRMRHGATPPSSAVWYAWGIRMVPAASVSASSPQTMSVIRSVNGVAKPQTAGTDVRLATPMILAL